MPTQSPSPGQPEAEEKLVLQVCLEHRLEIIWRARPKQNRCGQLPAETARCPRGHDVRTWGCLSVRTGKLLAIGGARIVAFSDHLDTIASFLGREPDRAAEEHELDLQILGAMAAGATRPEGVRTAIRGNREAVYEGVRRVVDAGWAVRGAYGEPYALTAVGLRLLEMD